MRFEDIWTLNGSSQHLEHWGYRGFRWLQIDLLPPISTGSDPHENQDNQYCDKTRSEIQESISLLDHALRTSLQLRTDLALQPDQVGSFFCDQTDLNEVWNLCATTIRENRQDLFIYTPVRERMPYEGDALTHGRCEMALSRSYDLTRKTWRYLVRHPGKFTEYRFMMAPLAWEDYLETGDKSALNKDWKLLWNEQAFKWLDQRGFVTKDPALPGCTDIVDWP